MPLDFSILTLLICTAGFLFYTTIQIVPQQKVFVVERLGKYYSTLNAGLHILIPLVDRVAYKHTLKEIVLDVSEQTCITRDNVQVNIDGILFFRVMDAHLASYGVTNYEFALTQLAQTTLRSEIGKIDLDRTFEEREKINASVVQSIDYASVAWGVKVLRYEIKSIVPPKEIIIAMEKQMKAEREKRALILESEGERDAKINKAEGIKQETIKFSEAQRQKQINEAEGQAKAIYELAQSEAKGILEVGRALHDAGGIDAARIKLAQDYIQQLGHLAKNSTTLVVSENLTDVANMIKMGEKILKQSIS